VRRTPAAELTGTPVTQAWVYSPFVRLRVLVIVLGVFAAAIILGSFIAAVVGILLVLITATAFVRAAFQRARRPTLRR